MPSPEFDALPMRFWNNWPSCAGSAMRIGQRIQSTDGAAFLYGSAQVLKGCLHHRLAVGLAEIKFLTVHAGIRQQVDDQLLHALGAIHGIVDVAVGRLVQPAGVALGEQLGEAGHHAERFLQIVGGHVGEALQLRIGPGELFGMALHGFQPDACAR